VLSGSIRSARQAVFIPKDPMSKSASHTQAFAGAPLSTKQGETRHPRGHALSVLARLPAALRTRLGGLTAGERVKDLDRRLRGQVFVKVVIDLDHCESDGGSVFDHKSVCDGASRSGRTGGVAAGTETFDLDQGEFPILGSLPVLQSTQMTRDGYRSARTTIVSRPM
jgi:hypothetical protein